MRGSACIERWSGVGLLPGQIAERTEDTREVSGRVEAQEWMDLPGQPSTDLAASLRDVRIVNRFLGGTSVTRYHLKRLLRHWPKDRPISILDLATGSGDIPRALIKWGRKHGYTIRYTCLDVNSGILDIARRESKDDSDIEFLQGDARRVEREDGSFDYVTCSMALHHFGPGEAVQILLEMDRLSRYGLVVNDLRRSRLAWLGIWLLTHLLPANRLTRHDGPLSTLRAYTPLEFRELAERAGLRGAKVWKHPFYRMALVAEKTGETA
jgi:SAM-dependent methyltransferase